MPDLTVSYGAGDALAKQTLYYQKIFTDWLVANGQTGKGIVTEMGIPGSSNPGTDPIPGSGTGAKYDERWSNVVQQWYEAANRANLHVTAWNASNWNVDLRAYRNATGDTDPLTYRTTFSSVLENNLGNGTYLRGVNLAGAEFSDRGPGGSLDLSHFTEPSAGYYYPLSADFATLASRGMILIRVPIRWERVQHTLKGALYAPDMAELDRVYNAAAAAGCKILLDIHNYGRYDTTPTGENTNGVFTLGSNAPSGVSGTMIECFADLWSRLATRYKNHPANWGFDICNEPHDLPGGASTWQEASRQAVEAIRLVDQNVKIAVEGYTYATIPDWTGQNGASAWLTETIPVGQTGAGQPRNTDANILWNGHHYFDPTTNGFDGGYQNTYDQELTTAQNSGFTAWTTSGYTAPVTNNTLQTGFRRTFSANMDSAGQFSPLNMGTNTITIPDAGTGNPGNSMKIVCSATSDEGAARKSLTGAANSRIVQFDFKLPTGSSVPTSGTSAILHLWDNTYANDLMEVRIQGIGAGYQIGLTQPSGAYTTVMAPGQLGLGFFYSFQVEVTDSAVLLTIVGSNNPIATFTGNFTGLNIGGMAVGKFYGPYAGTMYFDNVLAGLSTSYYAPPDGGRLQTITPPVSSGGQGAFLALL